MDFYSADNFVVNTTEFYSQELNRCFGKKDFNGLLLMRIALITSETNIVEIKNAYQEDFNRTITEELVSRSTNQHYYRNNYYSRI